MKVLVRNSAKKELSEEVGASMAGIARPTSLAIWHRWHSRQLSRGPLRLRVQARSRTRLRIAASIASLFRACFKKGCTIAPLSRG